MFDLTGHISVITGGNRGIGLELARGLAKAGATTVIWSRNSQRNQQAVDELQTLGSPSFAVDCDVSDQVMVRDALSTTLERAGRVDSLFANAGTSGQVSFPDLDLEDWNDMFNVNVVGTMLPIRDVSRLMIDQGDGGSIVVTSSIGATHGLPVAPHYSSSKAAQLGLMKALAVRLTRYGIRVNAICPGFVSTELTEPQQGHEGFEAALKTRVPLRRWGQPEDFEGVAVFLASRSSGFMTGTEVVLDGGYSAF